MKDNLSMSYCIRLYIWNIYTGILVCSRTVLRGVMNSRTFLDGLTLHDGKTSYKKLGCLLLSCAGKLAIHLLCLCHVGSIRVFSFGVVPALARFVRGRSA